MYVTFLGILELSLYETTLDYQTEQYVGKALRESALNRSEFYITSKYSGQGAPRQALSDSLSFVRTFPYSFQV